MRRLSGDRLATMRLVQFEETFRERQFVLEDQTSAERPSLGRFLLDRLEANVHFFLMTLPISPITELDPYVEARFISREVLLARNRNELELVQRTLARLARAQADASADSSEATAFASGVLKTLAWRFCDHPDWDPAWAPEI